LMATSASFEHVEASATVRFGLAADSLRGVEDG